MTKQIEKNENNERVFTFTYSQVMLLLAYKNNMMKQLITQRDVALAELNRVNELLMKYETGVSFGA